MLDEDIKMLDEEEIKMLGEDIKMSDEEESMRMRRAISPLQLPNQSPSSRKL
jgi:hypothetical protein